MRTGWQYILSRVATESLIGKVAFDQRPVDIWGKDISGRGKDNAKVLRPGEFKAQQGGQQLEQVSKES